MSKKQEKEKVPHKTRWFKIRISDAELKRFKSKARKCTNGNVSELIRRAVELWEADK